MKKTMVVEWDTLRMPGWEVINTRGVYGKVLHIKLPFMLIVIMSSDQFMNGVRRLHKLSTAQPAPKNDNCFRCLSLYHVEGNTNHEFIMQSKATGKVWLYSVQNAPPSVVETENIMRSGSMPSWTDDMVVIGMKT